MVVLQSPMCAERAPAITPAVYFALADGVSTLGTLAVDEQREIRRDESMPRMQQVCGLRWSLKLRADTEDLQRPVARADCRSVQCEDVEPVAASWHS